MKRNLLLVPLILFLFVQISTAQQSSPILKEPPPKDIIVPVGSVTFRWQDLTGVLSYHLDVATDALFLTQADPGYNITDTSITLSNILSPNTTYYWRVRGIYPEGPGPYSIVYSFTTSGTPSEDIGQIQNAVNDLINSNSLPENQGNILNNRLNLAQHQLDLNHNSVAAIQLIVFELRVTMLQFAEQINADNANMLKDAATAVIQELLGLRKFNLADYENLLVPGKFSLSQNYPNPFNPSTNIEYSIAVNSRVTIKVYDILGKEVATLVDKIQDAGDYLITWNASSFSSGIYFYRINAGDFSATKRMVLTK